MLTCAVYGCTNIQLSIDTDTSIDYHPFPKNEFCKSWIQACGWGGHSIDVETAHICSVHFEPNAYDTEIKIVDNSISFIKSLKHYAVPTLNLPESGQTQIVIKEDNLEGITLIYTLSQDDSEDVTIEVDENEFVTSSSDHDTQTESNENNCDKGKYEHVTTDFDLHVVKSQNKNLKTKIQQLEEEVSTLEENLSKHIVRYQEIEEECKQVETEIAEVKNATLTHQDQKAILSKVFSDAQIKMLFGSKKVIWSDDDMAVGYTIRHLSNKRCYMYLTKNLNIPLPGVSSVKRWLTTGKDKSRKKKKGDSVESSTPTE